MTPEEEKRIKRFNETLPTEKTVLYLMKTSHEQTSELEAFLDRFSALAPRVQIKKTKAEDEDEEPGIWVGQNLVYRGVPLGRELEPFLEAILLAHRVQEGEVLDIHARLENVTAPALIEIFFAPGCPFCPENVRRLVPLSLASELIRISVIDAFLFPEISKKRGVKSVPMTFLDDSFSWTGVVDMDEILNALKNRDPAQLGAASFENMLKEGNADRLAAMMAESGKIFTGLFELLCHQKWPVRLGAMVVVEELAELAPWLAKQVEPPLWERFQDADDEVRGDILYVLGQAGDQDTIPRLESILQKDHDQEVKNAASEAIESIRERM